jgi:putative FmdB family regulatory protein
MPLYNFLCPQGHEFESYAQISEETLPCRSCGEPAERQFSFGRGRPAQTFDPVVIHRDKEGNISYPGRANEPPPPGYERVELRTIDEVRKFEASVNSQEYERWQRRQEPLLEMQEQADHDRRSELFSQVRTEFGRNLLRTAIEQANSRPRRGFQPGFRIKIFSDDASNRRPWSDEDTGWAERRY